MSQTIANPVKYSVPARYRTAADWWDALGKVPFDRIVFDPLPGTATEKDVIRLDDHEDRLCELIDGTLVQKTMGYEESLVAIRIAYLLSVFVVPRKLGLVSGEAGMIRILSNRLRIPDVAFVSFDRLPGRRVPSDPVPDLVPDLAVEVLSESNTPQEMQIKLAEYFAAGVRLVWYVDLPTRSVRAYTSPDQVQQLSGDAILSGGNVLPGLEIPVSSLFDLV
ncbi:MAG: Uma2 family endonuclease [Tepidisphaeraceae bacterium]